MTKKLIRQSLKPDYVSPPGETLLEIIETRGMTQSELAHRMGRPIKTINEIIHNKAAITADTALQLMRVLGTPDTFWLRRESAYQRELARLRERTFLQEKTDFLKNFPINEMVKMGWLEKSKDKVQQLIFLLDFLGIASPEQWEVTETANVAFRSSTGGTAKLEAVAAWLRMGEKQAIEIDTKPFDKPVLKRTLPSIRTLSRLPLGEFIGPLLEACSNCGVALVFTPALKNTRVYGATRWLSPDKALIQMSLRYKNDGQFWFTFFHEVGHILLHGKRASFVEGLSTGEEEEGANVFARETLIPSDEYAEFCQQKISQASIKKFADKLCLSPGVVVGRLQRDGLIGHSQYNRLKARIDLEGIEAQLALR